jgi:chromosome segregation ATPase
MIKEHKSNRENVENQTWEEIEQIKERNKEQLAREIDQGMKQKSDLKLIKNEQHLKDTERKTLDFKIQEQNAQLQEEIQNTNRERSIIESLKNELHERQLTISDKDEKIDKLRKQVQELDKFKFVLDYKIKELKHKVVPKARQTQILEEQKTKMENEQKHYGVVYGNLYLIVKDMELKLKGLNKESSDVKEKIVLQDNYKKAFKDDLYDVLNLYIEDYKKLKKGIVRLHKAYVQGEGMSDSKKMGESD